VGDVPLFAHGVIGVAALLLAGGAVSGFGGHPERPGWVDDCKRNDEEGIYGSLHVWVLQLRVSNV
jgi:hypothetical protein